MPVLTKTKFVPIPEGVYNLKVVKYEQKEQKTQPGTYYYLWTIQVLDSLPEEFVGKDTFGVITADVLTENNNLSKFLANIGVVVEVGQEFDTDSIINYKFVGKVITVKNKKSGNDNNSIGQLTIPEYKNFEARQQPVKAKPVQRLPVQPQSAPTQTTRQPVQGGIARPAARPTAAVPPATARPAARPTARIQQPVVQEEGVVEGDVPEGSEVEDFPDQVN